MLLHCSVPPGQLFSSDRSVPMTLPGSLLSHGVLCNLCKGLHICNDRLDGSLGCSCKSYCHFRFPLLSYRSDFLYLQQIFALSAPACRLICHYCKAFSCFSCSGSFNGKHSRDLQVSLGCNILDICDHLLNLLEISVMCSISINQMFIFSFSSFALSAEALHALQIICVSFANLPPRSTTVSMVAFSSSMTPACSVAPSAKGDFDAFSTSRSFDDTCSARLLISVGAH